AEIVGDALSRGYIPLLQELATAFGGLERMKGIFGVNLGVGDATELIRYMKIHGVNVDDITSPELQGRLRARGKWSFAITIVGIFSDRRIRNETLVNPRGRARRLLLSLRPIWEMLRNRGILLCQLTNAGRLFMPLDAEFAFLGFEKLRELRLPALFAEKGN